MDHYFQLIAERQSCRNFSQKPVEKEKLLQCAEAARLAPSACDSQPWKFIAVNGGELREKVANGIRKTGSNQFTEACPAFFAVLEDAETVERIGCRFKNQDLSSIDLGLSVMQLCLAATDLGLSTCILGVFDEKELKSVLQVPENTRIRLMIAVGYANDASIRPKQRKSLDEILRFAE